jgi:hypothetical protein
MSDIRQYLNRIDAAPPRALAEMLRKPTPEQEQGLRTYLGHERYRRMRGLALRLSSRPRSGTRLGNVVLIPDFMGTVLSRTDWEGAEEPTPIWMNIPRLMAGQFDLLQLDDDGFPGVDRRFDIVPAGVFKRGYGELILTLAQEWEVRVLWYDWRKDLRLAASSLESKLGEWFGVDQPVHLVGFGMGGLVARWFIHEYCDRWKAMWRTESAHEPRRGGRLLLIGVPNQGTFLAPQILTGQAEIVRSLYKIDQGRNAVALIRTFRSFVSLYQLLPRPEAHFEALYDPETYRGSTPPQGQSAIAAYLEGCRATPIPKGLFDNALKFETGLEDTLQAQRTIAISGYGIPTVVGYHDPTDLHVAEAYLVSEDGGDGVVPLELARPEAECAREYFVKERHAALVTNSKVLDSLSSLLAEGRTNGLSNSPPEVKPGRPATDGKSPRTRDRCFHELVTHLASRRESPELDEPTVEEREVQEGLTRDLLSIQDEPQTAQPSRVAFKTASIEIGLVNGGIDKIDELLSSRHGQETQHVDALAVGLYIGEKPSGSTLELDRAISQAFLERRGKARAGDTALPERDLILTQFTLRGAIRAELGQPFLLTDPRVPDMSEALPGRLVAIVGMGVPGRFGVPELTVLARELCWTIGRLGKRHLAVAAIGTKNNNLTPAEAVSGWVHGIIAALAGVEINGELCLQRLTLVTDEAAKIEPLQKAILSEQMRYGQGIRPESELRFDIRYKPYDNAELARFRKTGVEEEVGRIRSGQHRNPRREPTRITLVLSGSTYRYGAITTGASVSEREVTLSSNLVDEVCSELTTERTLGLQLERGQFLGQLIVPEDLRPVLATDAPLVMMLDNTTARIPWEMVALPEAPSEQADDSSNVMAMEPEWYFLGTSRGLTRQLRTTFAPPPEPPPPPYRRLRVLVVADPARDAHLPGAELEGTEVADLFERFNTVYEPTPNRVEVVRMFGPAEAKLTNVLREIMSRSYDVMHFAGHCVYDKANPSASGWIFSDGGRLTAAELRRIDRVPRFIFSNACESGVTPDRSDKRSVALPPTFAESFFARGVANLVCTAWPVDDAAARQFALALYAALLGMRDFAPMPPSRESSDRAGPLPSVEACPERPEPMVMYEAMRYARLAIANAPTAARTWGAYQHYGDPLFRLLDADALSQRASPKAPDDVTSGGPPGPRSPYDDGLSEATSDSQKGPTPLAANITRPATHPSEQKVAAGDREYESASVPNGPASADNDRLEQAAVAIRAESQATKEDVPASEPRPEGPNARTRRPRRRQDDH